MRNARLKHAAALTCKAGVACLLLGCLLWLAAPPGAAHPSQNLAHNPSINVTDITLTSADQQSAFGFFAVANTSGGGQAVTVEDVTMSWAWIGEGGIRATCSAVTLTATINGEPFGPGFVIAGDSSVPVDYRIVCYQSAPFVAREIQNFVSIKLVGRTTWFSRSGRFTPGTEPPPPPPSSTTVTRVEESAATYTGSADSFSDDLTGVASSDGTIVASNVALSTASLTFTGTGISWIGFPCELCGIAKVYVNGSLAATIDTFAETRPASTGALYTASGLASGTHTLRIEATGTTNASSHDAFVVVDAFDVTH